MTSACSATAAFSERDAARRIWGDQERPTSAVGKPLITRREGSRSETVVTHWGMVPSVAVNHRSVDPTRPPPRDWRVWHDFLAA